MELFKESEKLGRSDVSARGTGAKRRRLVCESLESRQLMAADFMLEHNFVMPEDADSNGYVSPIDALVVINAINAIGENTQSANKPMGAAVDVDADGALTPLDALFVINFLNRREELGIPRVSAVAAEQRILRIEQAIAAQTLSESMELGNAQHLLAVLRAGGRPEVGDRMLNGQLTNDFGMSDEERINEAEIAKYVSEYQMGLGSPSMDVEQLTIFADTLKSRLEAVGVSIEVTLDVIEDVQSSEGLSMQRIMEKVKARLAESDIDVDAALPERMDVLFGSIVERLRALGINEEGIIAITNGLRESYESGTPITVDLLDEAFIRFHVDERDEPPSEADFFVSDLTEKLRQAGFTDSVIAAISSEIRSAYASGRPLTLDQVMARVMNSWQGWFS